tara:strand:+ start:6873 stop:7157 length:285 start_codon:yes stop_codon:yes gene_type:complete
MDYDSISAHKDREEVYKIVIESIEDVVVVADANINLDTELSTLSIDSLDAIDLMTDIEEIHSVNINNKNFDFEKIKTVRHFADAVYENSTFVKK